MVNHNIHVAELETELADVAASPTDRHGEHVRAVSRLLRDSNSRSSMRYQAQRRFRRPDIPWPG